MKRISLIANSSIQYYKYTTTINLEFSKSNKLYFHQPFDSNILDFTLDPLFKSTIHGSETFYRKQELLEKNFLINNVLKEDSDLTQCTEINDIYEVNNLKKTLKHFKNKWIPLPFFKENTINKDIYYPTDWVRLYFDIDDDYKKINFVLAIDTTLAKDEKDKTGPQLNLNPEENVYRLQNNDVNISTFLFNTNQSTSWIESTIADLFYGDNEELRYEQPIKQYIANYILLIQWLSNLTETPEIQIFTDQTKKIPVDLVIDIGNSATCALLFENQNEENFTFDKVKKLTIQDYSNPQLEHNQPFPMNLIFCEANFGKIKKEKYHNDKFTVPSFVRIGFEAENLINSSNLNLNLGYELKIQNSSPKRYLWDTKTSDQEWEFYPNNFGKVKKAYLNGISEQLKIDGSLTENDIFGSKSLFSRGSLMKFVFLEILIHTYVQINSFVFREEHGNLTIPRTLKRITISCPTAMIQHEQIALRKAAEDACKLLNNYVKFYFDSDDNKFWFEMPEIIPSVKDIFRKISELEERKDWTYDEATSCQMVFIYSLLSKKLQGNDYVINNYLFKNKDNIRIASIDIGAGTSDVMIADHYLNVNQGNIEIKPDPKFWESFKLAGDDLLKEIIQQIIIEGSIKLPADIGCTGIIENFAKSKGIENISEKLNGFFGQDSNNIGYVAKVMRKAFINQVAIPIALYYLKNANSKEVFDITFEEIISREFKNKELLKYFEKHFGFSFLELKFTINALKVNSIANAVFDSIIKQISMVLNEYSCDYVVLSGKPSSLISVENLFLKYLTVSPNNLVNLNSYWIGKWFPFSDNRGYIDDPKTIVSVGAIIALMSGKLKKINDLKLDTDLIKQKLGSTADYIVKTSYNTKQVILSPTKNENTVSINNLPYQFGYAKLNSKNYPVSNLFVISVDESEIYNIVQKRYPGKDSTFLSDQVSIIKGSIYLHLPLKINLSREIDDSKELIKIESIEDANGDEKSVKYFKLQYQTLDNEEGYWLDTCEFILNARNN